LTKRKDKTLGQKSPTKCYWCQKKPDDMGQEWVSIFFQKGDVFNSANICAFSEECYFGVMNLSKALTSIFWSKLDGRR
jgi:hypothetical protein